MFKLQERSFEDGIGHHQRDPVRVYASDPVQADRIKRSNHVLGSIIKEIIARKQVPRILEIGCGTGDISGPFAEYCIVKGIDCASQQIEEARSRFPKAAWLLGPAEYFDSGPWDIVVMCEFLEHILEPEKLVKRWLGNTEYAVISHPLDERKDSQLSGGDHCWSYSEDDFKNWFKLGGHTLVAHQSFQMGAYQIALGWSRKKKKENGHEA